MNSLTNHIKQHKSNIILVMFFLVFSSFTQSDIQHHSLNHSDVCQSQNTSFKGGEKLVYKLYYNLGLLWIPAGEVEFTVKENANTYELKAIGQTYSSYNHIFKVNDYFYSKIDKETMLPKSFVRKVEEGNYRLFDSISFDQNKNVAFSFHGKTKEVAKRQMHHLDHCMQDMVSNIYNMRNLNVATLSKGDNISVSFLFDKEVYPINVGFRGKEQKNIKGLGEFKTIKMEPELVAGNVFKKGDQMSLWVSDDENKIPLMIESPISVGSVKVVLKSYNGLRHPLSSKIND